jgi:hypothetical protein
MKRNTPLYTIEKSMNLLLKSIQKYLKQNYILVLVLFKKPNEMPPSYKLNIIGK